MGVNENLRDEEKRIQRQNKEKEFIKLILAAYKAEPVDSFNTGQGIDGVIKKTHTQKIVDSYSVI